MSHAVHASTVHIGDSIDPLVEVRRQPGNQGRSVNENLSEWLVPPRLDGMPLETASTSSSDQSDAIVQFFGPGSVLRMQGRTLHSPLVYVSDVPMRGEFDASLIDGSLPVAKHVEQFCPQLPYWPSYFDCSPQQRSHYLAWLAGGRSDPHVELGYVFIYFYGLERRALIDGSEHVAIAEEILRLYPIYNRSNSFRRYATALLWSTIALGAKQGAVPDALPIRALAVIDRWNNGLLDLVLAYFYECGRPIPSSIARRIADGLPATGNSIVVSRHENEFRALFDKRFSSQYPQGLILSAAKQPKRLGYRPASASLHSSPDDAQRIERLLIPDVMGISSQFKPLAEIWSSCVEDLKGYGRAKQKSAGGMTADVYEALPDELREGSHPEEDAWLGIWQKHADENGWPLVPIRELAELKGIPQRPKLTKVQCERLLRTADAIGMAIEPDFRITGKAYAWSERVTLFFSSEQATDQQASYQAASTLLRLGIKVASADGDIGHEELRHIRGRLEGQFNLSDGQSTRLERLEYLLVNSADASEDVAANLRERLSLKDRNLIGQFLVTVAAVDNRITATELKALREAYRSLGLDPNELDGIVTTKLPVQASPAVATPQSEPSFALDMESVVRIMQETQEVAAILHRAMDEDPLPADPTSLPSAELANVPAAVASPPVTVNQLAPQYQGFFTAVCQRQQWSLPEIKQLARQNGVMLAGAVEAINEWSQEAFGDWLLQEGDPYTVRTDLI